MTPTQKRPAKIAPVMRDLAAHVGDAQKRRAQTAINEAVKTDLVAEMMAYEIHELRHKLSVSEAVESNLRMELMELHLMNEATWEV